MAILVAFAVSNGLTSTLVMMSGVSLSTLAADEVDTAGTCLAFYLTLGLALGSFAWVRVANRASC
jgi:equilibrative nucleoside transporter 1/2/3